MKRTTMMVMVMVALVFSGGLASAQDKSCDDLLKEAEAIWLKHDLEGSDKALEEAKKKCPDNAEVYWRLARNEYDRIEEIPRDQKPPKDKLIERYRGVETLAQKCIDLAPKDGNCYQWLGIGMGRRGTTQGILNSLGEASDLEKTFLKAEKLAPQYRSENGAANSLGDVYTALGQFYRVVPEWLCVIGLKQIVGTCGDLGKSVEYQRKAVAREPERVEYAKELGVSLICHGQKKDQPEEIEEGKKILKDLQSLPEIKRVDPIDKEHAKQLVEDPSLACGYSRDAQQEQSKDAYKGE